MPRFVHAVEAWLCGLLCSVLVTTGAQLLRAYLKVVRGTLHGAGLRIGDDGEEVVYLYWLVSHSVSTFTSVARG